MPYPTEPTERTQQHTQKLGAYLALGVAAVFVAVIAYFVVFGGRPKPAVTPQTGTLTQGSGDRPVLATNGTEGQLQAAQSVRIDVMDKKEPGRQAGRLVFASMDPLEGHRYAVDHPEAWIYAKDGRSIFVRADSGRLYMPDQKGSPESGTLTGNIEIMMFAARADGKPAEMKVDQPTVTLRTKSLTFESAVGEVVTPDAFSVVWDGGRFDGVGLSLVFNQPQERLERGEIRSGGKVTMTPKRAEPAKKPVAKAPAKETPAAENRVAEAPAKSTPVKVPIETLYRAILNDKVVLNQAHRELAADKLQVMARLVDNKLPENAISKIEFVDPGSGAAKPATAAPPPATGGVPAPAAPTAAPTEVARVDGEEMTLSWTGPCVIVPVTPTPPELKDDHVAMRFTADKSGLVTLKDDERGVSGHAASIEYGATSRRLSFIGPGPASVLLDARGSGQIEAVRLDADLAKGVITSPGPGVLTSKRDASGSQDLSWTEKGTFTFGTKDGALTNALSHAKVEGKVHGGGRGLKFTSDSVDADFDPPVAGGKEPVLRRTVLSGNAAAESNDTGSMSGGRIEIAFDAPSTTSTPPTATGGKNEPRPRRVIADERVVVERDDARLSGDHLDATLIEIDGKKSDVGTLLARGNVDFASKKDFLSGKTEELHVDQGFEEDGTRRQLIDLMGAGTTITKNELGKEQGEINGDQLHIDGKSGRIVAFGKGNFTYDGSDKSATSHVDAAWLKQMIFDDRAGTIDLWGDATANFSPDVAHRNKADADRIKLAITPGTGEDLGSIFGSSKPSKATRSKEREVLALEAHGSILDRDGGTNAKIESRAYGADGQAQADLQTIHYIEGPSILADNREKTVDVPGAGKFLLLDQGPEKPQAAPGVRDLSSGDSRGVSLFTWAGSMHGDTSKSTNLTTLVMKDSVGIVHRALKDNAVTEIQCQSIEASLRPKEGSLAGVNAGGLELQKVMAIGGVYAASGPPKTEKQPKPAVRELIAQTLEYDALARRMEAKAAPGGLVTMFDPAAASPTTASWLTWDLKTDTIQVKNASGQAPSSGK